jgi:hypothetical protein
VRATERESERARERESERERTKRNGAKRAFKNRFDSCSGVEDGRRLRVLYLFPTDSLVRRGPILIATQLGAYAIACITLHNTKLGRISHNSRSRPFYSCDSLERLIMCILNFRLYADSECTQYSYMKSCTSVVLLNIRIYFLD